MPSKRDNHNDEKNIYANYSNAKLITLFQVPQYDQLQILICNGNSLTTLAGVEHIKHLWKLDVGNNQIRSLQHLSRFIALGSLILSNNRLQWLELQHIRHMFILDLRLDGNPILDADSNYRQHVLDCLPRIWMCDGIFISTSERNEIDEFFTQSSFTIKPVRHKLARDVFMPTNLKDRSINGLFGPKATDLFTKFPLNCFINSELDKRRAKHLASTIEDIFLTEMRHDDGKKYDEFILDNRNVLYHLMDIRQNHIEEFNMLLILLLTDLLFEIPIKLLNNVLDVTHIKTIDNLDIDQIFSSSEHLRRMIAALIYAGARLDRDENHPSAFYDKLLHNLSIVITNQLRQVPTYPNNNVVSEAKSWLCLEVMQVFIMCPTFYVFVENPNVDAIIKQALDRSPAYESVKDVLGNIKNDEKSAIEQKDLLNPILGNLLKMTIRTLSSKKIKKSPESIIGENDSLNKRQNEQNLSSPRSLPRTNTHHTPTIGDRIITAPQTFGRIITMPDADIAMIQFDHILAVNGSMITNRSLDDHTNYVSMKNFEWDSVHEYWKPKFALGDKITLHMTNNTKEDPTRNQIPLLHPPPPLPPLPSATLPRTLSSKTIESVGKGRSAQKLFEINMHKPKEAFVELALLGTSPPPSYISDREEILTVGTKETVPEEGPTQQPISTHLLKLSEESTIEKPVTSLSPVLIESTLLLVPDQSHAQLGSTDQQPFNRSIIINDYEHSSANYQRGAIHRVPVPTHNASKWFKGPNMQNERTDRMERVVSSLVRRSYRPMSNHTMPRVPTLTSPSSKEHAQSKGVRPGTLQDFCIESHRVTPTPYIFPRFSQSSKSRFTPSAQSYDFPNSKHSIYRMKSGFNQPCPTPAWM